MDLVWTDASLSDLDRIYRHLEPVNPQAAARTVRALVVAPRRVLEFPRIGTRLSEFEPREIHRVIIDNYEIRYEIAQDTIFVLRVWHAKEDR
jgi:plasmid stabilization system protein ParE